MIVKIQSRKRPTFRQLLNYLMNDKDRLFDKEGNSFVISHNLKGNDIDGWVKQFKDNEEYRQIKRQRRVYLTHEILSWHKQDAKKITLEKMEDMAREYIKLRNPKGMYIAVPHFDKEHYHIHICVSGIEYRTGKSMRLPKQQLQELKQNIQQYQVEKYPELSRSIAEHGQKGKALLTDKEYQYRQRAGRTTDKEKLLVLLENCHKRALSQNDFLERIRESGLKTYSRNGKATGVFYNGRKYRLGRLGFGVDVLMTINRPTRLKKIHEKGKINNEIEK